VPQARHLASSAEKLLCGRISWPVADRPADVYLSAVDISPFSSNGLKT
jgi:hypothetical protein